MAIFNREISCCLAARDYKWSDYMKAYNPRSKIYTTKQQQEMHKRFAKTQIAKHVDYLYSAFSHEKPQLCHGETAHTMMQVASKHCSYNLKRKLPFL